MNVHTYDEKKLSALPIIDRENPARKYTEKEEKYLRELVVCEFYNAEEPNLINRFSYGGTKNKMIFEFFPGGKYKVPRFIAKHVESCATPAWGWKADGTGRLVKYMKGPVRRFTMREVM